MRWKLSGRLFSRIVPLSLGKFLTSYLVQLEPPLIVIKWVPAILVGESSWFEPLQTTRSVYNRSLYWRLIRAGVLRHFYKLSPLGIGAKDLPRNVKYSKTEPLFMIDVVFDSHLLKALQLKKLYCFENDSAEAFRSWLATSGVYDFSNVRLKDSRRGRCLTRFWIAEAMNDASLPVLDPSAFPKPGPSSALALGCG